MLKLSSYSKTEGCNSKKLMDLKGFAELKRASFGLKGLTTHQCSLITYWAQILSVNVCGPLKHTRAHWGADKRSLGLTKNFAVQGRFTDA